MKELTWTDASRNREVPCNTAKAGAVLDRASRLFKGYFMNLARPRAMRYLISDLQSPPQRHDAQDGN
jgi:hypothetical protein